MGEDFGPHVGLKAIEPSGEFVVELNIPIHRALPFHTKNIFHRRNTVKSHKRWFYITIGMGCQGGEGRQRPSADHEVKGNAVDKK
jgi:hypothetical protein